MRLAIFDVDGTLVDSRSMITAAMTRAFADVGIAAPDQDRMLSIVGLSLVDAMAALTPDESAATHRRLGEAYKQAFWDLRLSGAHPEALFNGARDLLEDLRGRGVVLGIATGKSRRGVDHLIAAHGFENWFGNGTDLGHASVQATPLDDRDGSGRDGLRSGSHHHDRRHKLRHVHGPAGRGGGGRRGLGQPSRSRAGGCRRPQGFQGFQAIGA